MTPNQIPSLFPTLSTSYDRTPYTWHVRIWTTTLLLSLTLSGGVGCSKSEKVNTAKAETAASSATPTIRQGVEGVLDAYELFRAALAADQINVSVQRVALLKQAFEAAVKSAPDSLKADLTLGQTAVNQFKESADPAALRLYFGTVSKAVVTLLVNAPNLQKGRHIFYCPMAKGYTKWVQNNTEIENPYMGQKMLKCGGKSKWSI